MILSCKHIAHVPREEAPSGPSRLLSTARHYGYVITPRAIRAQECSSHSVVAVFEGQYGTQMQLFFLRRSFRALRAYNSILQI